MKRSRSMVHHLAAVVRSVAEQPLPEAVVEKAKLCLLDHLSALLYGTRSGMERVGLAMLPAFGAGSATLVGRSETASLYGAAFLHGLLGTAEDLDDSHRFASGLHLSAFVFPGALALCEERCLSGDRFLHSVAAGYEISGRIARSVEGGLRARGWHSTGAVGPFGAAAGSAVALDLSESRCRDALGIAASNAGGLFAFLGEGASVRHAHGAWAAANGLSAALLAASGMTGPAGALDGKDGYLAAFSAEHEPSFITASLPMDSGSYEILSTYHKLYACCGHAYPALTAALAMREALLPRLTEVSRIEARVYKAAAALTNPAPQNVDEAKFSLPYILAIALVHGDVGPSVMVSESLRDQRVRDIAARVQVREHEPIAAAFPRLRSAELVVTMRDGTVLHRYVDAPLGMPENPIGWGELTRKFEDAADGTFRPMQVDRIVAAVRATEELASMDELAELLRTS